MVSSFVNYGIEGQCGQLVLFTFLNPVFRCFLVASPSLMWTFVPGVWGFLLLLSIP